MSYIYQGKCSNSSGTVLSEMKECIKALQLDLRLEAEALNTPAKNRGKKGRTSPTLTPMTIVHEDALASVGRSKRAVKQAADIEEIPVDSPAEDKRGKNKRISKKKKEEEEEYEVETIIEKREMFGHFQYLVKWKGWEDPADRTWEPLENLTGSMNLVQIFEKKEEDLKTKTSKRKSDVKFIKENGDTMPEADESPKMKSSRASSKSKKTGDDSGSRSPPAKSQKEPESDGSDASDDHYEVEKILDMKEVLNRKTGWQKQFLVKWKGWDREEDQTWEAEDNLFNSKDLLKEFLAEKEKEKARETSSEKPAPKSRKARKSSVSTPEPRLSEEPEVVSIEDSDAESNSTPVRARANKKGKAKKETKKKTVQRKKKEVKKAESDEEDEDEYEVEKILKKRIVGKTVEYQVKWKGWDDIDDLTWEPLDNLASSSELIKEFESQQSQDDEDVELCEENQCQRIFTSKSGLKKHKSEAHGTTERPTKASKKSFENNVNDSGRKGTKRGRSPRVDVEDEEPREKKKPAEEVTPPKYKPGPKSRKAALNPWMDRESPDSGGVSSTSRTVNRLDMSDSEEEEGRVTSTRQEPAKTFDDLFGGSNENRGTSDQIVFNKDSDDESDGEVNKVNVDELIGGSDNDEENVFGLDWS